MTAADCAVKNTHTHTVAYLFYFLFAVLESTTTTNTLTLVDSSWSVWARQREDMAAPSLMHRPITSQVRPASLPVCPHIQNSQRKSNQNQVPAALRRRLWPFRPLGHLWVLLVEMDLSALSCKQMESSVFKVSALANTLPTGNRYTTTMTTTKLWRISISPGC